MSSVPTRQRLLDAAWVLCRTQGWPAVSTRALCSAVRVSQPAFYRHFGSLDELFVELHVAVLDRLADAIAAAREGLGDPAARVRAAWRAYLAFARAEPKLFASAFDRPATPGLEAERRREMQRGLAAIRADVAELDPAEGATRVLEQWAAVHGLAELAISGRLAPGSGGGPEAVLERLLDRLVGAPALDAPAGG